MSNLTTERIYRLLSEHAYNDDQNIFQPADSERWRRGYAEKIANAVILKCERCEDRPATLLLGKGLVICNSCYQSPEDVIRDLS